MVVDTNVLVYAADVDSEFNPTCREYLDRVVSNPLQHF